MSDQRLINADPLKGAFEMDGYKSPYVERLIDACPTVDAVMVVHGEWVWADDCYLRCNICTQKAPVSTQYQDEPMTTETHYCPNCGAKMDGGAKK